MRLTESEISEKYNVDRVKVSKAFARLDQDRAVLFAMSGKMGSGKDTVGDKIGKDNGFNKYEIIKTSYAAPLRKEISEITKKYKFGYPIETMAEDYNVEKQQIMRLVEMLNGDSIFTRTDNARRAIQYWGTDVRRKQNPNYWVNKTVDLVLDMIVDGKSVYVSDARFPNEVNAVYDLGGKVIRLDVPSGVRVDRISYRDGKRPTNEALNHSSETGLDEFEFKYVFDGCVDPDLLAKDIATHILKKQ